MSNIFDVTKFNQPKVDNAIKKSTEDTAKDDVSKNKDAFLQMMVAQLKNQDPMSPMENQDFLAQMAQFTTVEEIQKLAAGSKETTRATAAGLADIKDVLVSMNAQSATFQKSIQESLEMIQETLKKDK